MAVIKRGILGGVQNKIGNVVGSSWKGIATLRSLPLSVSNPRTAAQTNVRQKFGGASSMASALLATIIKPLWDRFAQQQSGYNAWIQANIGNFGDDGQAMYEQLVMSKGALSASPITLITAQPGDTNIQVAWNAAPGGDANNTDLAYIATVIQHDGGLYPLGFATGASRDMSNTNVDLPFALGAGDVVYTYLSFRKVDGTKVSDSVVQMTEVA